jgi:uncharacterized protein involved in exopolysaccharide biosynthesis
MQHHVDEFSVTDIRHTINEVWRVIIGRRWLFVFPFCVVTSFALVCSFWVPRQYSSHTVIKREQDPVFASMAGASWTHPYNEIRDRMSDELRDVESIEQILAKLDLPKNIERFPNGELTPRSTAARRWLARQVSAGLSATPLETSTSRDVFSIALTMRDKTHISEILSAVRDDYLANVRKKTVAVLKDVRSFFNSESHRCRNELAVLQKQLLEYDLQYPGIDPEQPDQTRAEQASLLAERVQLERELAELEQTRKNLATKLAKLNAGEGTAADLAADAPALGPNPRFGELRRERERILNEIESGKTLRFMTEQHPVIQRLRRRLEAIQRELDLTPREALAEDPSGLTPGEQAHAIEVAARKLEVRIAESDVRTASVKARLAEIGDRIGVLEHGRGLAIQHRQEYMKIKNEASRVEAELASWGRNIGPIEHILTVEDRDRTVHFATVSGVSRITKPVSPKIRTIFLLCGAIGAAVGVLVVLLAELVDRSFRTVKQLRSSLGIPVIESVDEIITQTVKKRRVFRSLVLMPATAFLVVGALFVAGAMAYLSVENPSKYESLKRSPQRICEYVIG